MLKQPTRTTPFRFIAREIVDKTLSTGMLYDTKKFEHKRSCLLHWIEKTKSQVDRAGSSLRIEKQSGGLFNAGRHWS
jgi:hypothetical protein